MNGFTNLLLAYGIIPTLLGLGAYLMRSHLQRLETLEKDLPKKLDEQEVRLLLADKIDPIREDVRALEASLDKIETRLDKIIDLLVSKR